MLLLTDSFPPDGHMLQRDIASRAGRNETAAHDLRQLGTPRGHADRGLSLTGHARDRDPARGDGKREGAGGNILRADAACAGFDLHRLPHGGKEADIARAHGDIGACPRELLRYLHIPGAFVNRQRGIVRFREIERECAGKEMDGNPTPFDSISILYSHYKVHTNAKRLPQTNKFRSRQPPGML